jgi:ribonuclease BN (tRNA processing enzyme)
VRCTRRGLMAAASAIAPIWARDSAGDARHASDRLVLLGTRGGPFLTGLGPSPSANLLVYRGTHYMIDAGYGATLKLLQSGVSPAAIRRIYITHHHSDHNLELGALLYNAWIAGLRSRVDVYGPPGLDALLSGYSDMISSACPSESSNMFEMIRSLCISRSSLRIASCCLIEPAGPQLAQQPIDC